MRLKLWPWTVLVLAVQPEHARLHRRLQALLESEGALGRQAVRQIERLDRLLKAKEMLIRQL